ncbi:MAG: protein kinase [Chloroflexota bacterium]
MILNNDGPRYYITRVIKEGGQGAVYETIGDDRKVYAVKEMLDRFVDEQERKDAIARFNTESQILQQLNHPRIPQVYAAFQDEGRHYLAMDFVQGEDLEEIVKREGAIAEKQVLEWADQILDVLEYLHNNGLIYRDMKPSNVMIDHQHGGIKIVDFGIAKVLQPSVRGTQIGTPGYAPPEQYQGLATHASDIYALGATLHHLLTGRDPTEHPPFSFPVAGDVKPAITPRTSDAVQHALQMKPEDRFQTIRQFRTALGLSPIPSTRMVRTPAAATAAPARAASPSVSTGKSSAFAPPKQPSRIDIPAPTSTSQPPAVNHSPTTPVSQPPAVNLPPTTPVSQSPPMNLPSTTPVATSSVQTNTPTATIGNTSTASTSVARPKAQSQGKPKRRGIGCIKPLIFALVAFVLLGLTLVFAFPDVSRQYVSTIFGPTIPARLISQPFVAPDLEIIVAPNTDEDGLLRAFRLAYLQAARVQHGEDVQVEEGTLTYLAGQTPVQVGEDERGAQYRVSMQGTILVPEE